MGDFQPSDVHKQYGICFRTPRYINLEVEENVAVQMQLRRPSDGSVSDSRPFDLTPIDGGRNFWAAKRMKTNYALFHNILSTDQMNRVNNEAEDRRRKVPNSPPAAQALKPNQNPIITQPIQLVHATVFPAPPPAAAAAVETGIKHVTCPTPDLPPPPTPLLPVDDPQVPPKAATMNLHSISNTNLIHDSYEDIQQVVYDDVDTKYDHMDFTSNLLNEAPLPPVRKRPPSVHTNTIPPLILAEDPPPPSNKPLPETPSKKSLISKLHLKSSKGKKVNENPGENGNRPSASLFQRLFQRSKSTEQQKVEHEEVLLPPPAVPSHKDDLNGNDDNHQIQDFIDEGNLEQLDNMITEFAMNMNESAILDVEVDNNASKDILKS